MVGVKSVMMLRVTPSTVTTKPDNRGEYEISRNTIACGNAGCPGATVVTNACAYYTSRTRLRVQRAPGIPRSPLGVAPTPFVGRIVFAQLGHNAPRECGCSSNRHRPARPDDPVSSPETWVTERT